MYMNFCTGRSPPVSAIRNGVAAAPYLVQFVLCLLWIR